MQPDLSMNIVPIKNASDHKRVIFFKQSKWHSHMSSIVKRDWQIVEILREMGVDYGQGYEIAKPIPIEEVLVNHRNQDSPLMRVVS